jgi:hypothetical protein
MLVSTGPIAMARPGWGLKKGKITSIVGNDSGGRPDVLCAQMLLGAAVSGVKVLALLPGLRGDDPVWQAVGELLGGGDKRVAASELRQIPLVMYASGTGREHVGKADLVYAPGLRPGDLEEIQKATSAAVLTLADVESDVATYGSAEIIRVGGDTILLDSEGVEISVVYDPSGPVYRPA